jgi:hypothetical protein
MLGNLEKVARRIIPPPINKKSFSFFSLVMQARDAKIKLQDMMSLLKMKEVYLTKSNSPINNESKSKLMFCENFFRI